MKTMLERKVALNKIVDERRMTMPIEEIFARNVVAYLKCDECPVKHKCDNDSTESCVKLISNWILKGD